MNAPIYIDLSSLQYHELLRAGAQHSLVPSARCPVNGHSRAADGNVAPCGLGGYWPGRPAPSFLSGQVWGACLQGLPPRSSAVKEDFLHHRRGWQLQQGTLVTHFAADSRWPREILFHQMAWG